MNIYDEINHIQIINIADHLKTQKYALNKQRAETIVKYVNQQRAKEERAKKVEEELKYTKEQFDKYWKDVCILKPRLAKVEELLGLYQKQSHLLWGEDFVSATPIKWEIDDLEKELEGK